MPRATDDEMIQKMKEQEARLKAKIQRAEARKRERDRKRDTQRKILLGARVLDRIARGKVSKKVILADMDEFLERPQERALFDLPPRPNRAKGDPQA